MKKRALIFDFDGTITDSYQLENHVMAETVRKFVNPNFQDFEVLKYYGPTEDGIVAKIVSDDKLEEARRFLFKFYDEYQKSIGLKPFPGIKELMLEYRHKLKIFILTGRSRKTLDLSLEYFAFPSIFSEIYTGSQSGINKTENILKLCADNNLKREEVVYIGDTLEDIKSMNQAGVDIISFGLAHSHSYQVELEKNNPNMMAKDIHELKEIIERLI